MLYCDDFDRFDKMDSKPDMDAKINSKTHFKDFSFIEPMVRF